MGVEPHSACFLEPCFDHYTMIPKQISLTKKSSEIPSYVPTKLIYLTIYFIFQIPITNRNFGEHFFPSELPRYVL